MNLPLSTFALLLAAAPVLAGQTQRYAPVGGRALAPSTLVANAPTLLSPTIPVAAVIPAAIPAPSVADAALVATAPALELLPANASAESLTVGGKIVFDRAASPAAGAQDALPVFASVAGETPAALKPAAPVKMAASAAAFVPAALAAAQNAQNDWVPAVIMGVVLIGVLLLLRWSSKNLGEITKQEIAEFRNKIEARKDEWLKIPGVKGIEIVPISRMDDTPPAYLRVIVDHIGPDNKDLLPQNHQKWDPVIASMFPQSLREAARIGSLDGKGYWPIAVEIAR